VVSGDSYYCADHGRSLSRRIVVPTELRDRLEVAARSNDVTVCILAEVLLKRGLKEMGVAT
jgi:hypothetical protein